MITIIDYKAGNIVSIQNMLRKIGVASKISCDQFEIKKAEKLILPGVGHFDHGMQNLIESGIIDVIKSMVVTHRIPILGICLGAQLMGRSSEEGHTSGLGLLPMKVVKFDKSKLDAHHKVPHMGWDQAVVNKPGSRLFKNMFEEPRFYFVHSYHFVMEHATDVLTYSNHGYQFTSAFEKDNIFGVQFHPEKSHKYGMKILENFAQL